MTNLIEAYANVTAVILVCLIALWLLSVYIKDASIIDIFWGSGFVICNWVGLMAIDGEISVRQWLVHALVTLWGLRLSFHLLIRNAGSGEDARYQRWRRNGGPHWWFKSFYRVYLFQGLVMLIVVAPVIAVNASATQPPPGWLDLLGCLVWITGFTFEIVSDQQLVVFKRNPENAGKVLNTGLWRYSLHPNYFGDALHWWGLWLIALGLTGGAYTVVGPLVMTGIFIYVSNGLLERALSKSKPDYIRHVQTTSSFVPLPPRRREG